MPAKFTYEFVKHYIESNGYTLLSKEYVNQNQKLRFKCDKGHSYETRFSYFRNGNRCPICSGNVKLSIDEVRRRLSAYGYKLCSDFYENNLTKLKVKCPKGHIYETTWGNFSNKHRCPECAKLLVANSKKLSYDEVKSRIEEKGFELLSEVYEKSSLPLKVKCKNGHIIYLSYNKINNGRGCKICSKEKIAKTLRFKYEYVFNFINDYGYTLISKKYKNVDSKLKIKCPKGHIFYMSFWHFKEGNRCSECWKNNRSSTAEKEIYEYVKNNYPNLVVNGNDRTQIFHKKTGKFLELDIFLPEVKKAIEFNGIYWHGGDYAKYKDHIKQKQCEKRGIDLLVINEDVWLFDKTVVFKEIDNFLLNYK